MIKLIGIVILVFLHEIQRFHGQILGSNRTVEISESLFLRRRHNDGKVLSQPSISVSLHQENSECFLVQLYTREACILMKNNYEHVEDKITTHTGNALQRNLKKLAVTFI